MSTKADSGDIIIILSDDEDSGAEASGNDPSCLIVETEEVEKKKKKMMDCVLLPPSALDEDVVVTFSRRAEVLPHARYDCHIHPFTATGCEAGAPAGSNQRVCDQCFCYICDKLASSCAMWCQTGVCHCNSHNKSQFWSNLRNHGVLGVLTSFKITRSEIDSHLQHAKTMLLSFRQELAALFSSFMKGQTPQELGLTQQGRRALIPNYTPVYELVSSFLSKAEEQDSRAAAIMNLGAAEDFIGHFQFSGSVMVLLQRVTASVQKQMVMARFTTEFIHKLQDFYQRLHLPSELKCMRNSLCVRPWDDVLLVSVLKGKNVFGVREDRGRKDILIEQMSVILLRIELLQRQRRYRELCRYLRVVQADNPSRLKQVKDLVPFFMCMMGHFTSARCNLFLSASAPASCFTPPLFLCYLRIFTTATAPKRTVSQPAQLCCSDAAWEEIKGAVPLKRVELVKFALRVHMCCAAVRIDARCWTSLLTIVNITALPEPNSRFLLEARDVVNSILQGSGMNIPQLFLDVYPNQALLLLVTGALHLRILRAGLTPAIPVLNTFKDNAWAFKWLCDNLSSNKERFKSFFQEIGPEGENTGTTLVVELDSFQLQSRSQSQLADPLLRL